MLNHNTNIHLTFELYQETDILNIVTHEDILNFILYFSSHCKITIEFIAIYNLVVIQHTETITKH